jgi:hypothetical protein
MRITKITETVTKASFVKIGAGVMPVLAIVIRAIRKGGRLGGESHDYRERDASQDDLHGGLPNFCSPA